MECDVQKMEGGNGVSVSERNYALFEAYITTVEVNNPPGWRILSVPQNGFRWHLKEKAGFPPAIKRNYAPIGRSVTAFH